MSRGVVFDPDTINALAAAYEHACAALGLGVQCSPVKNTVAQIIIERAKHGELDPARLCEAALDELRSHT